MSEHHEHHDHHEIPMDALLAHMREHNISHTEELEHIAGHVGGNAGSRILEAAELMRRANDALGEALRILKGE